jgi:hypothetical protein
MYKLTDEQYALAVQGLEVLQHHVHDQLEALRALKPASEPAAQPVRPLKAIAEPAKPKRRFSPKVRRQMSERVKALWQDPAYKARVLATRRRTLKRQAGA